MHKFLATLLLTLTFQFPVQTANAQCLLCMAGGFMLGSAGSSDQYSNAGGNVLYQAPGIAERLDNPLEVRIAASETLYMLRGDRPAHKGGKSIQEIFEMTIPGAHQYTLLQVERVIDPDDNMSATFWFAYIETQKIKPPSN